jgi:hypothetical protein
VKASLHKTNHFKGLLVSLKRNLNEAAEKLSFDSALSQITWLDSAGTVGLVVLAAGSYLKTPSP